MKKILIFYASYGGGHLNAAKSIYEYIETNYTDYEIEMIDCMKYVNKTIEKVTTAAYREAAKKTPWVWGKIYSDSQKGPLAHLSTRANKIMAIKLLKLLRAKKPDLIISTHPFGSQMCSYLKRKNKISAKIATIMTDFAPHDQWLVGHETTDYYFVANDKMRNYLISKNIPENNVYTTGIPLSKRFLENYNKEEIYKEFSLSNTPKTILFFGGGEFGLGKSKTFDFLETLIKFDHDLQIITIAGKNKKMKTTFEEIIKKHNCENRVKSLSFTNKIPQLMAISDLVITKPGGMTTTESLASHLPMIIINPIPGQEEENAEFLEQHEIGIWIKKDTNITEILEKLFTTESTLKQMKENTYKLAKPHSTQTICELLLN